MTRTVEESSRVHEEQEQAGHSAGKGSDRRKIIGGRMKEKQELIT